MTTLYLVRHCAQDNPRHILPGRLPTELSEEGKRQALRLRSFFADKHIAMIYSSAVLRCKQTAEIIAGGTTPIQYDQRLLETFSAYQGYWVEDWTHFFSHINEFGGESNADIQQRIVDFYQSTPFVDGQDYVICSHGDPLYFLFQHLDHQPLLPQDVVIPPEDYQPTGSIRIIRRDTSTTTINPFITQEMLLDTFDDAKKTSLSVNPERVPA